jgi:hypothetical protein
MSADGRDWKALDATPTFALSLRKAHMYALVRHARVLVSRTGDQFQLFDPQRLWLGIDREWTSHDREAILQGAPALPGIYVIRALTPVLIGDTENLRERLLYHLEDVARCEAARDASLQFSFEVVETDSERGARAADLIDWWSPPCSQHG